MSTMFEAKHCGLRGCLSSGACMCPCSSCQRAVVVTLRAHAKETELLLSRAVPWLVAAESSAERNDERGEARKLKELLAKISSCLNAKEKAVT